MSNPLKPALLCLLGPAQGGRFDQAPTQLSFWIGDQLGSADLTSGKVVETVRLPLLAFEGAFSRDGATFAYRAAEDAAGTVGTHLDGGGYDRTLHTEGPIGGHGGLAPGQGPGDQLEFSPDGTELLDYNAFRGASGTDNFMVYRIAGILGTYAPPDTFRKFQSNNAAHGVWAPTGSTQYFFVQGQGQMGEIDSLDSAGQLLPFASNFTGFSSPHVAPAGDRIVYDKYTSPPGDNCGGLPHLWTLGLAARADSQLSPAISSLPVFITQSIIWSDEEKPAECGPGGESSQDGVIVAHDLANGRETRVDMSATVPGIGPPLPLPNTGWVADVWF